jgi:hypothetical protein
MGIFQYAARTGRRAIEVLSRAGLSASYLTIRRAVAALADDAKIKLRQLVLDPLVHFVLAYDNLNWMDKIKEETAAARNKMRAAVHGNIHIVDYQVAYHTDEVLHPRCTLELFRKIFSLDIAIPASVPQPLMSLLQNNRPPTNLPLGQAARAAIAHARDLRRRRDELRTQPFPSSITPSTLLAGLPEGRQMTSAIISHIYSVWVDIHPAVKHLKGQIPTPLQVLPLIPKRSEIRPLPVVDFDEAHVKGNIDTVHAYKEFLGVNSEALQDRVIPVIADVLTVQRVIQATARRKGHPEPTNPELERMQYLQAWPALFHTQVSTVFKVVACRAC